MHMHVGICVLDKFTQKWHETGVWELVWRITNQLIVYFWTDQFDSECKLECYLSMLTSRKLDGKNDMVLLIPFWVQGTLKKIMYLSEFPSFYSFFLSVLLYCQQNIKENEMKYKEFMKIL